MGRWGCILAILFVSAASMLSGCPSNNNDPNHSEETMGPGGGNLVLGDAAVEVRSGALPANVDVELIQEGQGAAVERDENETPVSDIFTMKNNQDVVVDTADEAFLLTLPFDAAAVGKAADDEAKVYVKMDTEDDIFTLVGTITGGVIEVPLIGLPYDADFQVVYNPNAEFIVDEEAAAAKRLTQPPEWQTTQWVLHADATNSAIRSAVATVLGIAEATVTREQVIEVLRDRIGRNAREVCELFQDMGLREPNITVRTLTSGQKRFVVNLVNQRNYFENPTHENGVGQLHIACPPIAWAEDYRLGTIRGVIAHEVFHACVNGYDLKMGRTSLKKRAFTGYNEGMATVIGHTVDKGNVVTVRQNTETRDYSLKLNNPLCIHEPRRTSYTNNDFFAYVGKKYGDGSMQFVVGSTTDGDGFKTGVLDQTRKYLAEDDLLLPWASEVDSYLIAYRASLHNALILEFGESLASVYWDFARNRAYENNEASRLRADDPATRWELRRDRFEASGIVERTFTSDEQIISLVGEPALTNIPPMSTRAIVLNGSGFDATLTLAFDTSTWLEDPLGHSVEVKTYRAGLDGFELGEDGAAEFAKFGQDVQQVIAIVSNLSVTADYTVDALAETQPTEEPGTCSPDEPNDRWLIEYDFDCDGTYTSDDLWHLQSDGTVSNHFLGVIDGYSWTFVDGKLIISFGPGEGTMEGTMNATCNAIEDGRFVGDFVRNTCWRARRY